MPFADFVKTTVVLSAAAAPTLAVITLVSARGANEPGTATVALGWWAVATVIGVLMGRRAATSPPIARLLGGAKTVSVLPPQRPGRVLLARLWPLPLSTIVAGGLSLLWPQIPAVATGFALIWRSPGASSTPRSSRSSGATACASTSRRPRRCGR